MKSFCFAVGRAAAVAVLVGGCASTPSRIDEPSARAGSVGHDRYMLHAPDRAPPRLTVGVSYPDTQLILPWFLNDIIDFVNYR